MASYVMTVGEGDAAKQFRVPQDLMPQLIAHFTAERATEPRTKWQKYLLYCVACRRPCTIELACKCCGSALNRHVRMTSIDDFLARAEGRFLGGVA